MNNNANNFLMSFVDDVGQPTQKPLSFIDFRDLVLGHSIGVTLDTLSNPLLCGPSVYYLIYSMLVGDVNCHKAVHSLDQLDFEIYQKQQAIKKIGRIDSNHPDGKKLAMVNHVVLALTGFKRKVERCLEDSFDFEFDISLSTARAKIIEAETIHIPKLRQMIGIDAVDRSDIKTFYTPQIAASGFEHS